MISTLKKLNKKGFTLAELLVVVAIIAILVAIAIPVFSSSTKNAKIQADSANVRSWYAEETVKFLTAQGGDSDVTPAAFPVAVNGKEADMNVKHGKVAYLSDAGKNYIVYKYGDTAATAVDGGDFKLEVSDKVVNAS